MKDELRLELSHEGANTLRDFAKKLPQAMENVDDETKKLLQTYAKLSDSLGVHSEAFGQLLGFISGAKDKAKEAIEELPPKMETTADRIDDYVNDQIAIP